MFAKLNKPALISSLRSDELEYILNDIAESEKNGAQGFLIHLQLLHDKFKSNESLKQIFSYTKKPIMALNYRNNENFDDEVSTKLLLNAVRAGAAAVDIWAHMFDYDLDNRLNNASDIIKKANPEELTFNKQCITKQKELIKTVQGMGAQVLMSTHVGVELNKEQAIQIALELESRGADIVKIITSCNSYQNALNILDTAAELKKHLKVPYLYQCSGPYGRLTRLLAPLFGSSMVLCHQKYSSFSNKEKPLISDVKDFYRVMKWRINE